MNVVKQFKILIKIKQTNYPMLVSIIIDLHKLSTPKLNTLKSSANVKNGRTNCEQSDDLNVVNRRWMCLKMSWRTVWSKLIRIHFAILYLFNPW